MDAKYDVPSASGSAAPGMTINMANVEAAALRNPQIAEYMKDKDLMAKLNMLASLGGGNDSMQPMMMQILQQDPRLLQLFLASQGMDMADVKMGSKDGPGASDGPSDSKPKKEEPPPP